MYNTNSSYNVKFGVRSSLIHQSGTHSARFFQFQLCYFGTHSVILGLILKGLSKTSTSFICEVFLIGVPTDSSTVRFLRFQPLSQDFRELEFPNDTDPT
mmetsp:Transcript_25281/g.60877  ORF Transcript_25281/g.60877 Transcript_25281/m.60877 type:complete len:99 (+) Transcript_25281:12-308(+)